jgi:hypothetical protein
VDYGIGGGPHINCGLKDGPGVVHSAVGFKGTAGVVPGPVSAGLLFQVQFQVNGTGTGLFDIFNSTLENPGQIPYVSLHPIIHETDDAVFSNDGPAALFNTSPPILVVNENVTFDASNSFSPSSTITRYSWDFGDGSVGNGIRPLHAYAAEGSYVVTLNVTDDKGVIGTSMRTVLVNLSLGSLRIAVFATDGSRIPTSVAVSLYTGPSLLKLVTRPPLSNLPTIFSGLDAGTYNVSFTGNGVTGMLREEKVIEGWTSVDTVYLTFHQQSPDNPPADLLPIVYAAAVGGGLVIAVAAIIRKNRSRKKLGRNLRGSSRSPRPRE